MASGGILKRLIRIKAVITVFAKLFHGPKRTEQTTFTKWAVGANSSNLRIGEITTPMIQTWTG